MKFMECLFWAKVMKKLQASSHKLQASSHKLQAFFNRCECNSGFSGKELVLFDYEGERRVFSKAHKGFSQNRAKVDGCKLARRASGFVKLSTQQLT